MPGQAPKEQPPPESLRQKDRVRPTLWKAFRALVRGTTEGVSGFARESSQVAETDGGPFQRRGAEPCAIGL
jgi:hypothetical protein